jgi:EpsD family peptidyl-prolyl cis-trans isomerase
MHIELNAKKSAAMTRAPLRGLLSHCALLTVFAIAAAGCGNNSGSKPATQVVAKVNEEEITVSQLNRLLREAGADPSQKSSVRFALDSLIDQDLLLQEALKSKMDRDPEVVLALEGARRQILSDIYAERMIYPQTPITAAEEQAYYDQHPDLFAKRKVYQMEIFNIERKFVDDDLKAALDGAQTPEDVQRVLKKQSIDFNQKTAVRAAEQMPMDMLDDFASASSGDIIIVAPDETNAALMQLTEAVEKPLTLEQAKPYINQFLISSRNRVAMQERVKELRGKATITYEGSFAETAPNAAAAGAAPAAAATDTADSGRYLEKGLSGLK